MQNSAGGEVPQPGIRAESATTKKGSPVAPESRNLLGLSSLVGAAREQGDEDHQIRERKQPLVCLTPGCLGGPGNEAQVPTFCEVMQVIDANASQSGHFRIGEDFLTRLYGNQGFGPLDLSAC